MVCRTFATAVFILPDLRPSASTFGHCHKMISSPTLPQREIRQQSRAATVITGTTRRAFHPDRAI